jgi:replicative DNA helicase
MLTPDGFTNTQAPPAIKEAVVGPLIPHSIEAEEGLLGALAIDPAQMLNVGYLGPDDFYLSRNAIVYRAMVALWEKQQTWDFITLTERLESAGQLENVGGAGVIADMINFTPTSLAAGEYAAIIYNHSVRRQAINAATKAARLAYSPGDRSAAEVVNETVSLFSEIDATRNVSGGPQSMTAGANALLDRRETIQANGGQLPGLMTGIKTLDDIMDGIEARRLYLLAGRPGMGKSALLLQWIYNMARAGKGVLLFSLEMEEVEITARLAAIHCRIAYKDILAGRGDDTAIVQAIDFVSRLPIIIDTTPGLTVAEIRSRAQKEMITEDIDLIGVDHGGLVRPAKRVGDSYNDTGQVAGDMQEIPKQLDLFAKNAGLASPSVVCLVQLNRDGKGRHDKRPVLTDLRDTGIWEENADGVLFVHRDQYHNPDTEYPHLGEIIVAKNRAGVSAGSATVYADVATNRFIDLETRSVSL